MIDTLMSMSLHSLLSVSRIHDLTIIFSFIHLSGMDKKFSSIQPCLVKVKYYFLLMLRTIFMHHNEIFFGSYNRLLVKWVLG